MNAQTEHFLIPGAVGSLQCALDLPDPEISPRLSVWHWSRIRIRCTAARWIQSRANTGTHFTGLGYAAGV
jgi:hypothetical protein